MCHTNMFRNTNAKMGGTLCLLVAIDKHCDCQMSTKVDIMGNVWDNNNCMNSQKYNINCIHRHAGNPTALWFSSQLAAATVKMYIASYTCTSASW